MMEIPLWRSYLAGCILLGIAPCTAMVLVWGYPVPGQRRPDPGDGGHQFTDHAGALRASGGFLLGVGRLPVPWQALLLSILIYVALPLAAGYLSRKWIIAAKGAVWFQEKFLHVLTPSRSSPF
jgi:arsenite transporter